MPSPPGQPSSPPTLLQQLQYQQQQQAAQREADRQLSSHLLHQAAATAQLLQSGAFLPPPPSSPFSSSAPSSSSASSPYHHPYVAPLSAASTNVFRPSLQSSGAGDSKGFGFPPVPGLLSHSHSHGSSTALLSSAPSSSGSYSASSPSSLFSSTHSPPSASLYSQQPQYSSSASASSLSSSPHHPSTPHFSSQGLSSSTSTPLSEPSLSFSSSGASTPNQAPSSSPLSSLLFPQGGAGLSSMQSLNALHHLQMNNPTAFNLLLSNNPALQANQRQSLQQQQQSGRMSLSDSLSALSYLSNTSSPFQSFPSTPTTMSALTSLSSSPRFAKAVALEGDLFEGFGGLMKGGVIGRVKRACGNCKAAKTKCDSERPCRRCSRTGRSASCNDSVHKKRGRKRNVSGGDGGEEGGDGGDSGDDGDEDDATGGDDGHDSPSHVSHSHHGHVEKKAKGGQEQTEALKLLLLDVSLKFSHHLTKWRDLHRQQREGEAATGTSPTAASASLTNALQWFNLLASTDSLRKLLHTGKDGIVEDASSTDIDLLLDGPEVATALESAQKEIESSDTPGYTLPLYPVPYFTSPATFLDPSPHSTHPDAPRAFFNDSFCHLLASTDERLSALFAHLPSFLQHCHHTHLDAAIFGFVDAICSCRPSLTLSGARYSDAEHSHTFDCVEAISIHSVRGVPVALAVSLHSIVSVEEGPAGAAGARRLMVDDERMAKLADGDSEDEGEAVDPVDVIGLGALPPLSTAAATTAGETTGGDSDSSPIAQALGAVQIISPKPTQSPMEKNTTAG